MTPQTLELMHDQVCTIYRALTGTDLIVPDTPTQPAGEAEDIADEALQQRFADLEAMARSLPTVGERVPPFSFRPPLDLLDEGSTWLVEVAVPGVDAGDVVAERKGDALVISGLRRGESASNGRTYVHAEIPRGPFSRTIPLPGKVHGEPRVTAERGMILVRLTKAKAPAKAPPER